MTSAAAREIVEAGGGGLQVVDLDETAWTAPASAGVVRLGVHRQGPRPTGGLDAFDVLLTAELDAPRPWVGVADLDREIAAFAAAVAAQPAAAAILAQLLRTTLKLSFDEALVAESLGYSTLLASEGFHAWREAHPAASRGDLDQPRVVVSRYAGALQIRMTRAAARNAVDAAMRDALTEAFDFAILDPDAAPVVLCGEGAAFSVGGDLDEFGQADDPGRAHLIRTLRAPVRQIHQIRGRVTAVIHGAAVGSGLEIPVAAGRVVARPHTVFRLPELELGLIPGAGGTVSIPRRIGRRRTAYMALSGRKLDTATALAWGLVDAVERAP